MNHPASRSFLAVATCAAALLLLAARAPAQTLVVRTHYSGYTYAPYQGVGDIIRAGGDFLIKKEEAALLHEDVLQKKLETHEKQLKHWEWVRDFKAGARFREEERYSKNQLDLVASYASRTEIYNGDALNRLKTDFFEKRDLAADGSNVVKAEWLKHIHYTTKSGASLGVLKDDTIFWPELLLRSDFDDERQEIEKRLAQAKKQLQDGTLDRRILADLRKRVRDCDDHLTEAIGASLRKGSDDGDWSPCRYTEAIGFLRELNRPFLMLSKDPKAADYFKPLQGNTVAELAAYMKNNGFQFAPATAGGEGAYAGLHAAYASEYRRIKNQETPSLLKP